MVQNVQVQELLFALARDAKLNVDIHPAITGTVSMNVRDQTLTEILERIARQVDLRYEIQGRNLSIVPDAPYVRNYRVDYPNIQRDATNSISTSTSVASGPPFALRGRLVRPVFRLLSCVLLSLWLVSAYAAGTIRPGEYVLTGDWGRLKI